VSERKCGECIESMLGSFGLWCSAFEVHLWDEAEAEECEEFVPIVQPPRKEIPDGAEV
jgi:hypothetical protein